MKCNKVQVKFDHAKGLTTTDGAAPVGFELAGADKKYAPATAEIKGETVVLTAEGVKAPKYMRYGWAVFMNPNLVNEAGLPTAPCPGMEAKNKKRR